MAQRGRAKRKKKRRNRPPVAAAAMTRGYEKAEARNAAVRESLEPLEQGERPRAVTIGALVAIALVVANIPLFFIFDGSKRPPWTTFVFFMALMLLMAWGMWNAKYWAVLGFQALLAIVILIVSLSLMFAPTVLVAVLYLAILIPAGALFWFMVKALARIQMPDRPGA